MSPPHAILPHTLIRMYFSSFVSSCSSAVAPRVPSSPHVRPSSPHAHACTHIFISIRAPSSSAPFELASSPNESSTSLDYRSYAFVEFRSTRDAEDAYYDMYSTVSLHLFSTTNFPILFQA